MKNFIEVGKTEDEQEQQIKKWLKDNVPQIIAGITLGLGGIWGLDTYKVYQSQQSIDARALYLQTAFNNDSNTFEQLNTDHANSGYAQQATLMLAKAAAKSGNYTQALSQLTPLVNDENSLLANIANMRIASIQLEMGNFKAAIDTLDSKESGEFNGLYNQLKGDIYVADNQIDQAKTHYKLALTQISRDSELQSLINIKLADLN